jgi:hypothetical protein
MTDLECIAEAVKLQFNRENEMNFYETHHFNTGGFTYFNASITYQIIGAYLEDKTINVVVQVKRFECCELVVDLAIAAFENRVMKIIEAKIPEATDVYMKILTVIKENRRLHLPNQR